MMNLINLSFDFMGATLRMATPLIFASLGGLLSERSGVTNISLEGTMLFGAFIGATIVYYTHNPWLGFLAAMFMGVIFSSIYAFFTINLKSNQIVSATAMNMIAMGFIPVLCKALFGQSGGTENLEQMWLFRHYEPTLLALLAVILIWVWLKYTNSGLWLSFAGEHPEALQSSGISVYKVRWFAVLAGGALAALGGASLSLFLSSQYTRDMSAGRGFIALAALIMGKWRPIPTFFACLLFASSQKIEILLQGNSYIPTQLISLLPFILTIFVLAGVVGRSKAPSASGIPF